MYVLNIWLADHIQVLGFELLLQVLGDQAFQHSLPNVAGELLANQSCGSFAGTESRQFGPLLHVGGDTACFALYFVNRDSDLQRAPATFKDIQVEFTSGKK